MRKKVTWALVCGLLGLEEMTRPTRLGWRVDVYGREGNRIACQVAGPRDGPPVILTSGIGCGPVFYRHIAPELAQDHRIIYWDYRSHGQSDLAPDRKSYQIEHHAEDLEAVVATLTRKPPFMIGFSMGVQVTVEWAKRWGESAPGYVFLLGTPRNPLRDHKIFGNRIARRATDMVLNAGAATAMPLVHPFSKAVLRSRLSYLVACKTGLISPAFSREDYQEFVRYSSAVPPDAYLRCATGVLEHDAVHKWQDLHSPVLYLAAEKDRIVPASQCSGVSHLLPNGEYGELKGASHAGTVEAGRALAHKVASFVRAHEQGVPQADERPSERIRSTEPREQHWSTLI